MSDGNSRQYTTVALDLEETLISNALRPVPRPGLFRFLEYCYQRFERVVVMTAIPEPLFRNVAAMLASNGNAPHWFRDVEYINWRGEYKDLRYVSRENHRQVLLVDDMWTVVHPDQEDQYIPVCPWWAPYPQEDRELEEVINRLAVVIGETAG